MENEQSIDNVISEFGAAQKKARRFNTAATVVGVLAAIGMLGLIGVFGMKYTSTERTLTVEVSQTRSELETKLDELQLAKTELDGKQTELTRLQETVKSGSASAEVITNLQRDIAANQQKLTNANAQITELKGLMASMQNPDEAVAVLTKQLSEKESSLKAVREQVGEKNKIIGQRDNVIAEKDKAIAVRDRTIQVLKRECNGPNNPHPNNNKKPGR